VTGRRIFIGVTLIIFAALCGHGEDRPQGPNVLGFIVAGPSADPSLQHVLSDSFVIQLARRKASLQLGDTAADRAFRLGDAIAMAVDRDAQYLLVATYATTPTTCRLELGLYDPASGGRLRSGEASGRIDLSLDAIVAQALGTALTGVGFREHAAQALPTPENKPPAAPVPPWKFLAVAAGAAPMISTGAVSTYAKLGLLATLTCDARFPLGAGVMETGILAGACWMSATGAVSDAAILLVPVGADVQYLLNPGAFPGIILHVSGGPAMMSVSAAYLGDSLTKMVPYVLGGMTLDLPFTPYFGVAIEASYVAFLEGSLPIMAFAPTVRMYVQF
jgi:hypothetical protein